ncbi:hypothetical protein [Aminobacter sp. HY435]|uniref:hypothetical protein n=1 Tax=Aminobacter sp. HY435 TaxID=2970917 RepID=UPI0022B9841F|nr:hypothetical protein [Aminobacter sp. HY435]
MKLRYQRRRGQSFSDLVDAAHSEIGDLILLFWLKRRFVHAAPHGTICIYSSH